MTFFAVLRTLADRAVEAAAVIAMLAMLAVVVIGVGGRLINNPVTWSDELAQYLLVWLGFLGWIIATRRRSHIRIGMFVDMLPAPARRVAEIITRLAIIAFAAILIWQSQGLIARNIDVEAVTLPFPSAMLYVLLPVLGLALILQAAAEIAEVIAAQAAPHVDGGKIL